MHQTPIFEFLAVALRLAAAIQWSLLLYRARKRQTNRAFRESTGMTPTLFRDQFRELVDFSAENDLSILKIPSDFKN